MTEDKSEVRQSVHAVDNQIADMLEGTARRLAPAADHATMQHAPFGHRERLIEEAVQEVRAIARLLRRE